MVKCLCRVSANLKRLIFSYMMVIDMCVTGITYWSRVEYCDAPLGFRGGDCHRG